MIKASAVKLVGSKLKVGLLGFGSLGQHIYEAITTDDKISCNMEIQYVWNRSTSPLDKFEVPDALRLNNLDDAPSLGADIVIEVSHPNVSKQLAVPVMRSGGNFVVGSPTALADHDTELSMREAAVEVKFLSSFMFALLWWRCWITCHIH
jgi:predicted dinucleotide-utilizing enzyme